MKRSLILVMCLLLAACEASVEHTADAPAVPSAPAVVVKAKAMPIVEIFDNTNESNRNVWCINGTAWIITSGSQTQMFEANANNGSTPVACSGGITFPIPK